MSESERPREPLTNAGRRLFTDMEPMDMFESNGVTHEDIWRVEDEAARIERGVLALEESERPPVDPLREAALAVVNRAEPDDSFDGEFIEYLVPFDAIDALSDALASPAAPRPEGPVAAYLLRAIRDHNVAYHASDLNALRTHPASAAAPRAEVPVPEPLDALERLVGWPRHEHAALAATLREIDRVRPPGSYPHLGSDLDIERLAERLAEATAPRPEGPPVDPLREAVQEGLRRAAAQDHTTGRTYWADIIAEAVRAALASPAVPRPEGLTREALRAAVFAAAFSAQDNVTEEWIDFEDVTDRILARISDTGDTES